MKIPGALRMSLLLLGGCACSVGSRAAVLDLATTMCARYQNDTLSPSAATPSPDPINTVMWLYGFAVARSGAHSMFGEALAGFGFGLDAECKNNPSESLLDALSKVKPDTKHPMDLDTLDCATFAERHVRMKQSDPESAGTIMMWLFGFAVGRSAGHLLDAAEVSAFEPALLSDCAKYPARGLYEELGKIKFKN